MSAEPPELKIADYGMGNLRSVAKAFEHVGVRAVVSSDPGELGAADGRWSCPASAPFRRRCARSSGAGSAGPIRERAAAGVPLLGICLGMQLLFESSTEHGGAAGLGLLPGAVEPLAFAGAEAAAHRLGATSISSRTRR